MLETPELRALGPRRIGRGRPPFPFGDHREIDLVAASQRPCAHSPFSNPTDIARISAVILRVYTLSGPPAAFPDARALMISASSPGAT